MNDIGFRLLGGLLILCGISIWIDPIQDNSRFQMTFDFVGIDELFGFFLICFGVIFIWATFKKFNGDI
jgi:hypothetical protein